MKTATVVTQNEPTDAHSSPAAPGYARTSGHEISPSVTPSPLVNVRLKQVKTVVTETTKQRRSNGTIKTITFWEVRVGSAISKVYSTSAGERELFTLSCWVDGQRKREVFPSKQAAIEPARNTNKDLGSGNLTAPEISPKDRVVCARAVDIVAPYGLDIDDVASRFVKMLQLMSGEDPMRAVEIYHKKNPPGMKAKMVKDVVAEMMAVKRSDDLSARCLKQLDSDLTRFASQFRGRLDDVNGTDVDKWLRDLGVGPRTHNNLRNSIKTLFKFGIAQLSPSPQSLAPSVSPPGCP
jgi:hypothetical protein